MKIKILEGEINYKELTYGVGEEIPFTSNFITFFTKEDCIIQIQHVDSNNTNIELTVQKINNRKKNSVTEMFNINKDLGNINLKFKKGLTVNLIKKYSNNVEIEKFISTVTDKIQEIENKMVTKEELHSMMNGQFKEDFQASIKQGIKESFEYLGLTNGQAKKDIEDLRDLINSWRNVKKTIMSNIVSTLTKLIILAILTGIAVKIKFWEIFK